MKKVISLIILILALSSFFVLWKNRDEKLTVIEESLKNIENIKPVPAKIEEEYLDSPTFEEKESDDPLEARMDKWDREYDRIEREWDNLVRSLFRDELGLSPKVYQEYKKIREGFEADKIRAFEAFHQKMQATHGDEYTYNPTEEELAFDNLLKDKYDKVIQKLLGKEAYTRYLLMRDNFNNDLIERQKESEGTIEMEL